MFDKYYQHHLVDSKEHPEDHVLHRWTYNFQTEQRRYIALVELYNYNIYVIKYYADAHSASKNKYRLLFNNAHHPEKTSRIIRTCVNIMLEFYQADVKASFGFIATSSINKHGHEEPISYNQRFRIYKGVMLNFFSQTAFVHSQNRRYSSYLLINRDQQPIQKFKRMAETMFKKIYRELERL